MENLKTTGRKGSSGGKARAITAKLEKIAREKEYAKNPKLCTHCYGPILQTPSLSLFATRQKKFCSSVCAGKFNSSLRKANNKLVVKPRKIRICYDCKQEFQKEFENNKSAHRKFCSKCRDKNIFVSGKEKSEVQRHSIASNARIVTANRTQTCFICGYDKHVQVCHIRPVFDFPATATVSEINSQDNLVLLCPNHHWEFDHLLMDEKLRESIV